MRKLITGILISVVLLFTSCLPVKAIIADKVYIANLPEYIRTNSFELSYTAISDTALPVPSVKFFFKKEGGSYAEFASLTGYSGRVQVTSSQINEQAEFYFKVEINGGTASDETSTNYDISGPSPVSGYSKELVAPGYYRLKWKNPHDDDFSRVFIYRSASAEFTADGSTKMAEVGGAKEQEMTWENTGLDADKTYYYAIRAVDKAGNSITDSVEFVIEGLEAPEITEYPRELENGEVLVVEGTTYSNADVTISLEKEDGKVETFSIRSDGGGNFTFISEEGLSTGVYRLWAQVTNSSGAKSEPSEKVKFVVGQPTFIRIGTIAIGYLSILIPLLGLIILLIFMLWYSWHRFIILKKRLRKEVAGVERDLHKIFDLLREDIHEQIKMLEHAKTKRQLTKEEEKVIKQLRKDLDDAEKVIKKEVRDIEKEIDK